ncbi:MAG TPA: CinA family protein [Caulobacteraceae bacterium]|jgi:nicotinamide-nucleotide amidase|nr:CinA family protein [Caulobacteraceae bacterium]
MTETLDTVLPKDVQEAVGRVLKRASDSHRMIATAESCTGGLVASLLTDVDGYGHVFDRGFVAYTSEAKHDLLGVDPGMLERAGAVSEPVARAMAEGALRASKAALAIAVTGYAGPGAPDEEPGLVHFALARRDRTTLHRLRHFGDRGRGAVRLACLQCCLELLEQGLADVAEAAA